MKSLFLVAAAIAVVALSQPASASDNYSCWQQVRLSCEGDGGLRNDSNRSDAEGQGKVSQTGGRTANSSKG